MTEKIDLYTLLRSYADKTQSVQIPLETFVRFLQNSAKGSSPRAQRFSEWAVDTRAKVVHALDKLVQHGHIEIRATEKGQIITLKTYYAELIAAAYGRLSDSAEIPLPSEESLHITLPPDSVCQIAVQDGIASYLANPNASSASILKLVFSEGNGSALVLCPYVPSKILGIALMKLHSNFEQHSLTSFFSQQLVAHFPLQQAAISNFFETFMADPKRKAASIIECDSFYFSLWLHLNRLIKNYVEQDFERVKYHKIWHTVLIQSAELILGISKFFMKVNEKARMFNNVSAMLLCKPYVHTLKDIYEFKTPNGYTITEIYGENEIDNFVRNMLQSSDTELMPVLIKFSTGGSEDYIVRKECIMPLCAQCIQEANPIILQEIKTRWTQQLKEYRSEPSMRSDNEFEELIKKILALTSPLLSIIARDQRTAVIQEEIGTKQAEKQLFNNYKPIPWRVIFRLSREAILASCRLTLPWWYSSPFLVKIITLFKYGFKTLDTENKSLRVKKEKNSSVEIKEDIQSAAKRIALKLIQEDESIDSYLNQLNDRWNQNLNKKEREKIRRDVNSIIKKHITLTMKILTRISITEELLDDMSRVVIETHPSLKKINDSNSLHLYIKVYLVQLFSESRF